MSIRDDMVQKVLGNPGKYSIQQLQAAMRSGSLPAYVVVPIIQDKVQQQKQMQTAMAMQQQLPQTTIAEQVMQEAAQMGGGVDQLPTNLPQEYAEGGIVAFDEGGEVERYQGGGALRARAMFTDLMREEQLQQQLDRIRKARDAARAAAEAAKTGGPAAAAAEAATTAEAATGAAKAASGPSRLQAIRQALQPSGMVNPNIPLPSGSGAGIPGVLKGGARLAGKLAGPLAAADLATSGYDLYNIPTDVAREYYGMQLKPGEEPSFMGDVGVRARTLLGLMNPFGDTQQGIAAIMEKQKAEEKQEGEEKTPTAPAAKAPATQTPAAKAAAAASDATGRGAFPQKPVYQSEEKEAEKRFETLEKEEEKRRAAYETKRAEIEGKVAGKPFEEYEKELREEAMRVGATKEQAKYMALVEAGLAMMGGTSQNAFENISKGALVGVGSYKSALKDVEKAQKEHRQALANIEQARRAEAVGNRDRELAYMEKAFTAETESKRARVDAIMKARGVDRATALKMYEIDSVGARTLEAARIAASGRGQGGLTEAQLASIRGKVIENLDPTKFRLDMAKKLIDRNIKKAPPLGADATFDKKVDAAYEAEINKQILRRLGKLSAVESTATEQPAFAHLGIEPT